MLTNHVGEEIFFLSNKEPLTDAAEGKYIYHRPLLFQTIKHKDGAISFHSVVPPLLMLPTIQKRKGTDQTYNVL